MDRLIRTIVLEHKNKRIHLTDIESALKERGINLFADPSKQHRFIKTVETFIARGILYRDSHRRCGQPPATGCRVR